MTEQAVNDSRLVARLWKLALFTQLLELHEPQLL